MRKTRLVLLIAFLVSACRGGPGTRPAFPAEPVSEQATGAPTASSRLPGLTPAPIPGSNSQPVAADASTDTPGPAPRITRSPLSPHAADIEAQVVKVVDGDTIDVDIGGKTYPVRYIGMDAPEDTTTREPGGPEATARNRELVQGKRVRLEKDVSETDRYGRLLRYVYVGDTMVNAELVRQGYARAATFPPDVKHQDLFLKLQREAREAGRGLWGRLPVNPPARPSGQRAPTESAGSGYVCNDCIKGNISTDGEKIYHFPGCEDYDKTVITESKGERWFSSEAEAQAAGWRRAQDCP